MKILLTGASGFIGSQVLEKFNKTIEFHCIDRNLSSHRLKDYERGSIVEGHDLLTCDLPDVDAVIHLAGSSGVRHSLENPTEYWKNNVIMSQRIFDHYKNTRILYASSSTAKEPWRNPYAMSKYAMEAIAPPNSLGMRFTTVYGPGAKENMLIPKIIRNDIQYVNINHTRDFIHVYDIVSALDILVKKDLCGIIDIGTGKTHKLTDMVTYFGLDYEGRMGDETERLDNKADTEILTKYGWKATNSNLYKYIEENRIRN